MSVTDGVSWESLCRRFWKDALRTSAVVAFPVAFRKACAQLGCVQGFSDCLDGRLEAAFVGYVCLPCLFNRLPCILPLAPELYRANALQMFPQRKENLPAPPPDLAVLELPFPAALAADGMFIVPSFGGSSWE